TFLDDDDESYPDLLEETYRAFETEPESVGFAWSGIRRVRRLENEEVLLRQRSWTKDIKRTDPSVCLSVGTGYGLTVRRHCFDVIGLFDENLRVHVDLDLLIRLAGHFDYTIVPGVHVKVYVHEGEQLTDNVRKRVAVREQIIKKNASILDKNIDAWLRLHCKLATNYYKLGDRGKARSIY